MIVVVVVVVVVVLFHGQDERIYHPHHLQTFKSHYTFPGMKQGEKRENPSLSSLEDKVR